MANYSICTQTFDIGDEPKAKALKPLEEAAEVFGAWQNRCDEDVVDELADCIQACANMTYEREAWCEEVTRLGRQL